ncbi:emp24/gp25L/p24 family/GOLD-domain-containing protein [Catenaria anguillulae PL171]|uniref:Emp24/gp25L/p24 family/GOLD-domain-containing protein n=1 Tax=Catenaria anguillulae PL171 TaxID=765915 RepID=A0A1Y2HZA2_9FUNG|nr:emp24/gp25L/p24 family/GOLD-domain-containing protein [Catenaria anguillulae PL171]
MKPTPPRHYAPAACVVLLACLAALSSAIKFELPALAAGVKDKNHRCLSAYIGKNVLVRGSVEVGPGDHQSTDVHIYDEGPNANKYYQRVNLEGHAKFAFTTLDHAEVFVCVTNNLESGYNPSPTMQRALLLTLDTGADAREDSSFEEKNEHLKPVEIELRRLESVMDEIVDEMEYLKSREARMRNTNESTNARVLGFSMLTMATLILLGCWQVYYLKQFFTAKKLI